MFHETITKTEKRMTEDIIQNKNKGTKENRTEDDQEHQNERSKHKEVAIRHYKSKRISKIRTKTKLGSDKTNKKKKEKGHRRNRRRSVNIRRRIKITTKIIIRNKK